MEGRRRTVVAPEESVIFTVSYTQQTITLPFGIVGGVTPLRFPLFNTRKGGDFFKLNKI